MNATLLAALRNSTRDAAVLVKVELSGLTLYLSTREVNVATNTITDPRVWENALDDVGPINEPGDFLTSDVSLCTFEFRMRPQRLTGQSEGDTALDLFHDYTWDGATVTVYLYELGVGNFLYAEQVFKGLVERYECEDLGMRVWCVQRNDWVTDVPGDVVTRSKYPRAPEKSIGVPIPICYGDLRGMPARSPAAEHDAFNQGINSVVGMRRPGVRGVVVSLGQGGSGKKGRVLFAGHACKLFNDDTQGSTPGLEVSGRVCEIDPNSGDDFNAASGTGFDFADITSADVQPFTVFYPVPPMDSKAAASNNADNSRAATDAFNDTSFTVLDYDAGQREAVFMLPDVAPVGSVLDIKLVVGWMGSGLPATSPPGLDAKFVGVGGSHVPFFLTDSATPTASGASITSTYWPTDGWSFADQGCYIQLKFSGVATGAVAHVFYVGLSLKIRPAWPVVSLAHTIPGYVQDYRMVSTLKGQHRHFYSRREPSLDVYVPEVNRVDSTEFYATLQGHADSGGTYTGSGTDLIERAPDVLNHFLQTYCAQSSGDVLTSSSTFGSLVDLRDDLKTWRGLDMKLAYAIDERRKASQVIADLMSSVLAWAFISRFSDKWKAVAWKSSKTTTYDIPLRREDLLGIPRLERRPDLIANNIECRYGNDARLRRMVHDVALRYYESRSGHSWRNLSDEDLEVVASESDRIDFYDGSVRSASLTPGTYTPINLADHVSTQMSAVAGSGKVKVAWGFDIKASFNDRLYINDGSAVAVTLTAGSYATGALLATEVQTQLNAASSNWACTYSVSTRKFTISRSAGTAQLLWSTGVAGSTARSVAVTLGFIHGTDKTAGSPYVSDFEVEPERFVICDFTNALKLLWESGAQGIDAGTPRPSGGLLGFDMARDYNRDYSTATRYCIAHSCKNDRQTDMLASAATYGERPARIRQLAAVFDTDTAREVRNRMADLLAEPPVFLTIQTERCPDIERGMVFETHSSIDEWLPYTVPGSDGSWGSKKFMVFDVQQVLQPTLHQEIVALAVD